MKRLIQCTQCGKRLQVPENLLGKKVKCPACGAAFTAEEGAESPPPALEEGIRHEPNPVAKAPSRPLRYEDDDPLDEGDLDEDDDESLHSIRRRDDSDSVIPPAVCLLITGILGILMDLFQVAISVASPELLKNNVFARDTPPWLSVLFGVAFALLAAATVAGSIAMMKRKAYALSMAGAIIAIVNVGNCCCILGLPFGVWALIVLCRPEVKDSFGNSSTSLDRRATQTE